MVGLLLSRIELKNPKLKLKFMKFEARINFQQKYRENIAMGLPKLICRS